MERLDQAVSFTLQATWSKRKKLTQSRSYTSGTHKRSEPHMWNLPWAHPFVIAGITILRPAVLLFFFFFWEIRVSASGMLFQWVLYTVYETYKPLLSTKFSLKMSLAVLFTHLKIILLQCFQFSIFNKISGIQTDPL